MGETVKKRMGRTAHDIWILTSGGLRLLAPGQTPYPQGSDEEAGFIAQRATFYKNAIRRILRPDKTTQQYFVGDHMFSVVTGTGTIGVSPGIVTTVGLGSFPYHTTLVIYDLNGRIIQQLHNAGNPELI